MATVRFVMWKQIGKHEIQLRYGIARTNRMENLKGRIGTSKVESETLEIAGPINIF